MGYLLVFLIKIKYKTMVPNIIKEAARNLRNNMTKSEKLLWEILKDKKLWYRFLRQKPVYVYTENNWLDRYIIPDFYCSSKNLIIEVDWSVHYLEEVLKLDKVKNELINNKWLNIIRIENKEINDNIDNVIQKIKQELNK